MTTATFDIIGVSKQVGARVKRRRAARILGGVGAAALGVVRRGAMGPFLVLSGAALFVRGLTDKPLRETVGQLKRFLTRPHPYRFGGGTRDIVDEASWQSFPASDPPGYGQRPL